MKFPRPSLSWLGNALFLMIVGCAVVITLLSRQTEIFGWRGMIVRSGSMEPAISTGSVILVQRQGNYDVNDIITFRSQDKRDQLITHRVADKKVENWQASFTTRGDANPGADTATIRHQDIIGKTQLVIPGLGYVMSFLQSPLGVTLAIVVPATILIYEQLKNMRQTFQERGKAATVVAAVAVASLVPFQHTMAVYATTAEISGFVMSTTRWNEPTVESTVEEGALLVTFDDAGGTDKVTYRVSYSHTSEENALEEVIEGEEEKESSEESGELPEFYLGTCSDEVCTPHENIENLKLEVKFFSGEEEIHAFEEEISLED